MPCPKGKKASKKCKERNGDRDDDKPASKTKDEGGSAASKTSNSARSTSVGVTSSIVSSSAMPSPTTDCAALGRRDEEMTREMFPDAEDFLDEGTGEDAAGVISSRDLQTRESYKPKKGSVCAGSAEFQLVSGKYPPSGAAFMVSLISHNANRIWRLTLSQQGRLAFGYKVINDCGSYDWEAKQGDDVVGDTEHVLEWSMVS